MLATPHNQLLTDVQSHGTTFSNSPCADLSLPYEVYRRNVMNELQLVEAVIDGWFQRPTPHFRYQPSTSSHITIYQHVISLIHCTDDAIINIMQDFCHFMNLKSKVRQFIDSYGSSTSTNGRCLQSFSSCLKHIIERYDWMIMEYEVECKRQMSRLAQPYQSTPAPLDHNIPITLLSFQQHLSPYIKQLTLMGDIIDRLSSSHQPNPSAATLLTTLHAALQLHSLVCTPALASLLFGLFLSALLPYMEYLDAWTTHGQLIEGADSHEFMIYASTKKTAEGETEYLLRKSSDGQILVPAFLKACVQQILLTGRSRAMVTTMKRAYCNDSYSHPSHTKQLSTSLEEFLPSSSNLFEIFHRGLAKLFQLSLGASSKSAEQGTSQPSQAILDLPRSRLNFDDEQSDGPAEDLNPVEKKLLAYDDDDSSSDDEPIYSSADTSRSASPLSLPRASASQSSVIAIPSPTMEIPATSEADSTVTPDTTATSSLPPLTSEQQQALDIFVSSGFETIHPWLRPPPEEVELEPETQPLTTIRPTTPFTPIIPSESSASTESITSFHPSILSTMNPSSTIALVPPILVHNQFTEAASLELVAGEDAMIFEVDGHTCTPWERTSKPPAQLTSQSIVASSFLAEFPIVTSSSEMQSFIDLLLFYAQFPTYTLHEVIPKCLLAPLQERYESATHQFIQTIMRECGLNSYLAGLREFFLMADGFLSTDLACGLFEKLDSWDLGIIGLNDFMQSILSQSSNKKLARNFQSSFTLILIHQSSSAIKEPDAEPIGESIALEHPHSILCLEQLHVECDIPWPLNQIITEHTLNSYNKIWRFLLQLKRAEGALTDCALGSASAAPNSRRPGATRSSSSSSDRLDTSSVKYYRNVTKVQHDFYLLKSELLHFLRTIIDYVLLKTTNTFWSELLERLSREVESSDLNEMHRMHQEYLDKVLFQILLTPKLTAAAGAIKRVLGLCLDLRLLYKTVLLDYMEGKSSEYYFDPPIDASQPPLPAHTPQWSTYTGRSLHGQRSSLDTNDDPSGSLPTSPRAATSSSGRRICLPGVHNFHQFRLRLFSTSVEQLTMIRHEFRQNLRFIMIVLNKIVENGGNAHCQSRINREIRDHNCIMRNIGAGVFG